MPISEKVFIRAAAVNAAASVLSGRERVTTREIITEAEKIVPWINAANVASQLIGKVIVNDQDGKSQTTTTEGAHVSTAMTVDDVNVVIQVNPEDDHNDATPDQLVWTADDSGAILQPSISADTHTWTGVPLVEGTVNVSASDPSSPDLAPFTAQIVVGAGTTSQLVGTVTVTPAA